HGGDRGDGPDGVGDALARDVRSRAVDRLIQPWTVTDARAGQEADGAGQHRGFIREDIAEHVARHHHVEARRVADQVHGRGVHVLVCQLYVRVLGPLKLAYHL